MSQSIPSNTLENFSTFGDMLRFLRRRAGITQTELSIAVGYSTAQISRLEQNLRLPDMPTIEARFAPALGLEDEPRVITRLLDLAAKVRREDAPAPGLCPYKGLSYFDETDVDLFVGREELTSKLVEHTLSLTSKDSPSRTRFLAVVGASGSGKSSLVRAGLVPALHWNMNSSGWVVNTLTPTVHPLESLAASLTDESGSISATAVLMDDLARDPRTLHLLAKHSLKFSADTRLLLVIDQFEELFALCSSEEERTSFISNLLTAASIAGGPVMIIITLRADFYGSCASYPQLRETLAQQQEYIGAMSREELRRAIEEPARRGRWDFEPGLVDLLLHDVGHEPGALPLLSHALLETWKRRRGRLMTMSGYISSGGVRGAIAETAQSILDDKFTHRQKAIARRIFLRLTELGNESTTGDTRRRASLTELIIKPEDANATLAVLKELADARLITTEKDSAEVAHEALIREWPTLRGWLEDNREALRLHRHITEAAHEWQESGREPSTLFRGARLSQAREWILTHTEDVNALEKDFIVASQVEVEREASEQESSRQRELENARKLAETERQSASDLKDRNRIVMIVSTFALVLAVLAAIFGFRSQANFTRAEAQRLAAEANTLLKSNGNSDLIALLSLQSLNLQYSPQGDAAITGAASLNYPLQIFNGHTKLVWNVAFSPDGKYVLSASDDKTARLWDRHTGREIRQFKHPDIVYQVAISQDQRYILTNSADTVIRLWDLQTGKINKIFQPNDFVDSVVFSPDGKFILGGSRDARVRIWDVKSGEEVQDFVVPVSSRSRYYVSPDGRYVLTSAFSENSMRLWALGDSVMVLNQFSHDEIPWSVTYSNDDREVLVGYASGSAILWDANTGKKIQVFTGHTSAVTSATFSPDGNLVLTSSADKTVRLWDKQTGTELYRFTQTDQVYSSAISSDGKNILTGSNDGSVRLWNIQSEPEHPTLSVHNAILSAVSYSPDGKLLATGGSAGMQVWEVNSGTLLRTFPQAGLINYGVQFSPDGKYLLSGNSAGVAILWEINTGKKILALQHASTVQLNDVAFSPDGKHILTGGSNDSVFPTINIWERETGKALPSPLPAQVLAEAVMRVAYSPDGKYIVTAHQGGSIQLWISEGGFPVYAFKGHTDIVNGIAFSPNSKTIASASSDKTVRLWNVKTGQEIRQFIGHTDTVWSVVFSPDGMTIATSSADGTARLWDAETGEELRRFIGHTAGVENAAFSPDGKFLVTVGDDGIARLWDSDFRITMKYLCSILLRDLNAAERSQYNITDTAPTCPIE